LGYPIFKQTQAVKTNIPLLSNQFSNTISFYIPIIPPFFLGEKSLQVLALPDFDGFDVRDVRSWEIVEGMSPPWAKKMKNCFQRWKPLIFPKKSGFPGICVPSLGYSSVEFVEKG